jgi:hypothetical protein
MQCSLRPILSISLLCLMALSTISRCNAQVVEDENSVWNTATEPIGNSPLIGAKQGLAIDGRHAVYISSTNYLSAYDGDWNRHWINKSPFDGLPSGADHIGDIAHYDGKIIAPVESFAINGCKKAPNIALLAVYDPANGDLLTWSNISADAHEISSVTIVPEENRVVVSSYCSLNSGYTTLWNYDLNALLTDAPGSSLRATETIKLSKPIANIQGIDWNSRLGLFLVSADTGGKAGSLWFLSGSGAVNGPIFNVPDAQGTELEGVDFSTGNIYYLENGYVHAIGEPTPSPEFTPEPGNYPSAQTVSIANSDASATTYYTTNGNNPTAASTKYVEPISISNSETVKAIAIIDGRASSPVVSASYTITK